MAPNGSGFRRNRALEMLLWGMALNLFAGAFLFSLGVQVIVFRVPLDRAVVRSVQRGSHYNSGRTEHCDVALEMARQRVELRFVDEDVALCDHLRVGDIVSKSAWSSVLRVPGRAVPRLSPMFPALVALLTLAGVYCGFAGCRSFWLSLSERAALAAGACAYLLLAGAAFAAGHDLLWTRLDGRVRAVESTRGTTLPVPRVPLPGCVVTDDGGRRLALTGSDGKLCRHLRRGARVSKMRTSSLLLVDGRAHRLSGTSACAGSGLFVAGALVLAASIRRYRRAQRRPAAPGRSRML